MKLFRHFSLLLVLALLLGSCSQARRDLAIDHFNAEPSTILEGQSASLDWQVLGAPQGSVTISPGNFSVAAEDSLTVVPDKTTSYTLSVALGERIVSEVLTVEVVTEAELNRAPEIEDLGEVTTLSLSVSGPEILELDLSAEDADNDPLEWRVSVGAAKGYADVDETGLVRYQAYPGESGLDYFTVEVSDEFATDSVDVAVNIR